MKIMIAWHIPPGSYKAAVDAFLSSGAPAPEGLTTLGRWHAPGSSNGWHLVEGDPVAAAQLTAEWGHLLEFQITPVIEDEDAAKALSAVHGK